MQSLDEFHTGVCQSWVQAQVSRCSLSPLCWFCVSVSCFGILHGFYFPTWPASGTLRLLAVPAGCQHSFVPTSPSWGRGTATRLCKEWLGNDTKSHYPEVKYVTSLLNVDRALTHLEGMVHTYCLRFWNSGNPAKYFMSLKSSLFIFTSQDNKTVLVGKEKTQEDNEQRYCVCVRDVHRLRAGASSSVKPHSFISPK